jgi:hypothetical protein
MAEVALNDEQQDVVRRYVAVWRRWRQGIRGFADLEDHMKQRHEVLVDGIAVDNGQAVRSSRATPRTASSTPRSSAMMTARSPT